MIKGKHGAKSRLCLHFFILSAFSSLTFTVNQPKMNGWVTLANALGLDMLSSYNPRKSIFHLLSRAACGHMANKGENHLCFKR